MTQLSLIENSNALKDQPERGLLSLAIPPLDGEFLYSYDPSVHLGIEVGSVISVPFGKRVVPGFVVSRDSDSEASARAEMAVRGVRIKSITCVEQPIRAFSEEHLTFFRWIAKYYAEPLSKILDLAVPTPAARRPEIFLRALPAQPDIRLGAVQRSIVEYLASVGRWASLSEVRAHVPAPSAPLRALIKRQLIEQEHRVGGEMRASYPMALQSCIDSLTEQQRLAVSAVSDHITKASFQSFLLHGVTGSGKTEVYLELIIEALRHGRSALVVVPEIALTPQLIDRFEARLKHRVALLHSSLSAKERWSHWQDLLSGDVKIAVGARSAIFAPIQNLGLIVIDEEHDSSFKQGEGIRYNARDLALVRAKLGSCPIVLGSATPSLETFHHARTTRHSYLQLTHRFYASPPLAYSVIDLNRVKPWEMPSKSISPQLLQGLLETLQAKEQAFVLYNRRGFASYLQCARCEHVVGCPHCSVTLTYHRKTNSLLCHFCGFSAPPPIVCSGCGAQEPINTEDASLEPLFSQRGAGTERVAEELLSLIPQARIAKLDRDSVQSIADYVDILGKVRERHVDILVGTQMIAKGHDLPDVTFVGIVDCDVGLHMPDFRASERSFQLLTQVSGRAGRRDKQGRVVLQTRVPSHASLRHTTNGDYSAFAEGELELRRSLDYPPFQRLLRIIIAAEEKSHAQKWAHHVAAYAAPACSDHGATMLGPAPAPIEKVRSHWRYHILCKAGSAAVLQHIMQRIKAKLPEQRQARFIFDLDPQDML